ncbi:MAG TPA: hypothetical protein V6D15_08445 [Oculatellaceae cyanobacterium]|jgi:hypothetical protein
MSNISPLQKTGFHSEKELQNVIAKVLNMHEIEAQSEVFIAEGLRADIVTLSSVIEVKLKLSRESLFSAVGQVLTYKYHLKKERGIILGCQVDCKGTIKYFRAIQPVVKVIHLQAGHLRSLRNFVNSVDSGLNYKGENLTENELKYSTRTVRELIKKMTDK